MTTTETRRYRILGLLGQGGYGAVYRARLEGPEGFSKDVAVKIITQSGRSDQSLARFRDEARILGLVRDRAVVGVDPPVFLDGRLALVMEYIDGQSLSQVLEVHGALPAAVAIELVGEVARALDKVFHQPGPDGLPLELVHRDVKPGNLQVTPGGEVRILDFGIASARFGAKESITTETIAGTAAYMAPERLAGLGGQAADVYALGVVLHQLVTGEIPSPRDRYTTDGTHDARDEAQVLAEVMRALHEDERPSARDVARRCRMLRARFPEPDLRDWAEAHITNEFPQNTDSEGFVGRVLSESHTWTVSDTSPLPQRVGLRMVVAALFGGGGVAAVLTAVAVIVAVVGVVLWSSGGSDDDATAQVVEPTPGEPDEVIATPEPEVATPEPAPTVDPKPRRRDDAPPVVAPTSAAASESVVAPPRPDPAVPDISVTVTSVPFGLDLWVDGELVGRTPQVDHPLAPGEHEVRLEGPDGQTIVRTIRVGARAPVRYVWRVEQDSWESGF